MKENIYGRLLIKKDLDPNIPLDEISSFEAMTELSSQKISCNRCGTVHLKSEVKLQINAYYCPSCINMGRIRSDEKLYHLPQISFPPSDVMTWRGTLTAYQKEISEYLIKAIDNKSQILVHAVTGSGKTEMIYEAVNKTLKSGGAVAIASPRIDVCIELHKRLSKDFNLPIALLHGEAEPYFRTAFVISSNHQLLRFKEAFDLLIIDEVDAFPFRDNEMLYFASKQARKKESTLIYLTATSTENLEKQVQSKQLKRVTLARRFHANPLVVPKNIWRSQFYKKLKEQRKDGFPLLIFVPEINFGLDFTEKLTQKFPDEKIGFVASTSKNRLDFVEDFRQKKITILVSTTILERGVTFPMVDSFVYNADHFNFTSSALIQIAGRVGRSFERPTGRVYFFHQGKTKAMVHAIAEIKKMNKIGYSKNKGKQ
ncbi:MAG: DEAD/DEAH box helicase [Lactovum sp.]